MLTDGNKEFAERFGTFWFIYIIVSYQGELKQEEFQVWELTKFDDGSALVKCTDGNDRVLKTQTIEFTDFKATTATFVASQ